MKRFTTTAALFTAALTMAVMPLSASAATGSGTTEVPDWIRPVDSDNAKPHFSTMITLVNLSGKTMAFDSQGSFAYSREGIGRNDKNTAVFDRAPAATVDRKRLGLPKLVTGGKS